jgi:hypothetical protein
MKLLVGRKLVNGAFSALASRFGVEEGIERA